MQAACHVCRAERSVPRTRARLRQMGQPGVRHLQQLCYLSLLSGELCAKL